MPWTDFILPATGGVFAWTLGYVSGRRDGYRKGYRERGAKAVQHDIELFNRRR